jgi:hypothetical protein
MILIDETQVFEKKKKIILDDQKANVLQRKANEHPPENHRI